MKAFYTSLFLALLLGGLQAQQMDPASNPEFHVEIRESLAERARIVRPQELGILEGFIENMPVEGVAILLLDPSPAAGVLQCNDIITAVRELPVHDWYSLRMALEDEPRGRPIPLTVWHEGALFDVAISAPEIQILPSTPTASKPNNVLFLPSGEKTRISPILTLAGIPGLPPSSGIQPAYSPLYLSYKMLSRDMQLSCYGFVLEADVSTEIWGIRVLEVSPGSVASKAGLQPGDMITSINGSEFPNNFLVLEFLENLPEGSLARLMVQRREQTCIIELPIQDCMLRPKMNVFPSVKKDFQKTDWEPEMSLNPEEPMVRICEPPAEPQSVERSEISQKPLVSQTLELSDFNAAPNPTNGPLLVQFTAKAAPLRFSILDQNGRMVYDQEQDNFNGWFKQVFQMDVSGIFIIKIVQEGRVFTHQIVCVQQ